MMPADAERFFVKICGVTTEEDALLAVGLGASAIGFVLAPSPRQLAASRVGDIVKRLPPDVVTLGVFRDEAPERVVDIVNHAGLTGAQLHGHETPESTQYVRERVSLVIKAFPAGSPRLHDAERFGADLVLVDAPTPGSGRLVDFAMLEGLGDASRLVLAGGLTPENVTEAIHRVAPYGVDVATGVEASPGVKDPRKVAAFIAAARAAAPVRPEQPDEPFDWRHR
ncbi:MAG TPA: phosphoribosylanthranilate isomerase [Acidimicrobiales bacterium]|jgi:phosphoribosylanthranilate isomerase|nr:phosphoribosylanthranilate isomerase [Acidimicrobiales bacterium]